MTENDNIGRIVKEIQEETLSDMVTKATHLLNRMLLAAAEIGIKPQITVTHAVEPRAAEWLDGGSQYLFHDLPEQIEVRLFREV